MVEVGYGRAIETTAGDQRRQYGLCAGRTTSSAAAPRDEATRDDGHGAAALTAGACSVSITASSDAASAWRSYPPSTAATRRPRQHSSATARSSLVIAA